MKWLYLSCCSISRHLLVFLLITLEYLCILIGANALLANYNQSALLQRPYERFLDRDGYYLNVSSEEPDPDDVLTVPALHESDLIGDWSFYRMYSYYGTIAAGNSNAMAVRFIVYDDTFWDAYDPVLASGKKMQSRSQAEIHCIATANCNVKELRLPLSNLAVTISGKLGDLCYIPSMDTWKRNGSFSENFYKVFDIKTEEAVTFLMSETQWLRIMTKADLIPSDHCLAMLNAPLTEEDQAKNEELLRTCGSVGIELSVLSNRAKTERETNAQRFLPILIALLAVAAFGTLCTTGIQVLQEQKITAVYCLCGMRVSDVIKIHAGVCIIQSLICASVLCCLWIAADIFGWNAKFGLLFRWNNLAASALVISQILMCSLILPYLLTKSKCLPDLLSEVAES